MSKEISARASITVARLVGGSALYLLLADDAVLVPLSAIKENSGPVARQSLERWAERLFPADEAQSEE